MLSPLPPPPSMLGKLFSVVAHWHWKRGNLRVSQQLNECMGKKTLRNSWSLVRFSFFVYESDKLFARRILQSIRCHLRSFSMHPFNYDTDKLKPLFNSMLHVQSNQSIIILQVSECTACLMHRCTKRRSICTGVRLDTWVTVSYSWVHLGWGEIQRCMTPTPHQTTWWWS